MELQDPASLPAETVHGRPPAQAAHGTEHTGAGNLASLRQSPYGLPTGTSPTGPRLFC